MLPGELLHADADFTELGVIDFITYDGVISLEPELDGNDWEAELLAEDFQRYGIAVGHYLYFPDTEWGGRVEKIEHISRKGAIKIAGVTWRGMLIRKVISPPAGKSHLDLRDIGVSEAMALLAAPFGGLFSVEEGYTQACGKKFRYQTVLEGITDMLGDLGRRLEVTLDADSKKVWLRPVPIQNRSEEIEFSGDYDMSYTSTIAEAQYNHIIALGQGEQEQRTVLHLYLLPDGSVTQDANAAGIAAGPDERALVYDYPNCEDEDELLKGAKKRLLEYAAQNAIDFDFDAPDIDLPLGDKVGMRDRITGLEDVKTICRKILRISADGTTLQYSVE